MQSELRRARWPLNGAWLVSIGVAVGGCGQKDDSAKGVGAWSVPPGQLPNACATPRAGCPCSTPDEVVECGSSREQRADSVVCELGKRVCQGGTWGECSTDHLSVKSLSGIRLGGGGLRPLGLAVDSASCDEPCDPYCRTVDDTPDGLDLGDELETNDAGVTLTQGEDAGSCASITITPTMATIVVTGINGDGTLAATPSQSATFTAVCDTTGALLTPSWSLDSYDRAVVDAEGTVTLFAGTAGALTVTASSAAASATATVNVIVAMEDRGSSSSVANAFDASGASDAGNTLYPYKSTVFPLDLRAPLVQWNTGGKAATDVQVALRYPSGSSSPTFLYSKIYNGAEPKQGTLDASVPAWRPPQEVWTALGRTAARGATAAARTADIVLQRRYSSSVHAELVIPVTFATEPLRGTVYYTQYLRTLFTTSSASSVCSGQADLNPDTYTPGFICPVGNCTHPGTSGTSSTRSIELSSPTAPNKDPFNGTAGCPVCHSVSADGKTYVSGNQYWQVTGGGTSSGIDSVGLSMTGEPLFSAIGDTPNYYSSGNDFDASWPTEQSRGFAYSAITPDGSLVLQSASFWGNTANTPSSNNIQDGTLKGVTNHVKPYFAVTTSNPGLGVQFATTGPLPANGLSGNVLTANANGVLTVDAQAMATGYSILVKNEASPNGKKNGVYVVTATGSGSSKWKLTRRNDADGSGELVSGMDVRVSDGNANRGGVFYVTTSGTISVNSTAITLGTRAAPSFPSMMVPTFSPDGTKVAYVNADKDSIGGYPDTGWRRGLSIFSFDPSTRAISGRKRLLNTWSSSTTGTPMKWPFFESDSRSLVYVETDPSEYCGSNSPGTSSAAARACQEAAYGSMSPTTRGYWPGRIYSIDTMAPASTRTELTRLTNGEDSNDFAKSYQPTILPFAVGGYRWAIFTSPRAYGNQFNARAASGTSSTGTPTDFTCAASMLWVAAIDDETADGSDRSHPAFFLPGQNVAAITTQNHYVNERGYLVKSVCKNTGDSCTLSSECGGDTAMPATAACRVPSGWTPSAGAPQRTCQSVSATCGNSGDSCDTSADCCGGETCVNFECSAPPSYEPASFDREYESDCAFGFHPRWQLFGYHLATPGDSAIDFSARVAESAAELDAAEPVSLGASTSTVELPSPAESKDVGAALDAALQPTGLPHLRISITLNPSSDGLATPVLEDWQMTYTCVPAE